MISDMDYTLADKLPISVYIGQDGRFQWVNTRFQEVTGYGADEAVGLLCLSLVHPDDRDLVRRSAIAMLRGETDLSYEYRVITKKGDLLWSMETVVPIMFRGRRAFLGSHMDITRQKRVAEALRTSEERSRTIIETIADGYFEVDLVGNTVFCNDRYVENTGYSREELKGLHYRTYMDKGNADRIFKTYHDIYKTGKPARNFESEVITKNGEIMRSETSVSLIRDSEGKPIGFRGISRNITERRKMEEALRASEERYRTIIEDITEPYSEEDLEGNKTYFNNAYMDVIGYSREELTGLNYRSYMDDKNVKLAFDAYHEVYKSGNPVKNRGMEWFSKSGEKKYYELSISLRRDGQGKPIGFRTIYHDTTERQQMEEALRASEERYRTIIESIPDAFYEVDLRGNLLLFNTPYLNMFETSQEEMQGSNFRAYTDEKNAKVAYEIFHKVYETGVPVRSMGWEVITKSGKKKHVELSVSLFRDNKGNPLGFRGIYRDVTERKKAEDAIRASEERYRTIIDTIPDAYYEVDLKGNAQIFNDAFLKLYEYEMEEMQGLNYRAYTDKVNADIAFRIFNQVFKTGMPVRSMDWEVMTKGGIKKQVELSVSPVRDVDGKPMGFRGIIRDVTERRQAEEAIRASEERFRMIIETIPEPYAEVDLKGNHTFFNEAYVNNQDFSREELQGLNYRNYMEKADAKRIFNLYHEVFITGKPVRNRAFELISKTGEKRQSELSVSLIHDAQGKPSGFRTLYHDTTERKKMEDALRASEERSRAIIETTVESYFELDLAGDVVFFNDEFCKILGYRREEMEGLNNRAYQDPEAARQSFEVFNSVYKTGNPAKFVETEFMRRDGERRQVELSISLIRDGDGKPTGFRVVSHDISERKKVEASLLQAKEMAEVANKAKSEFLASMSHEIRTPMNAILGMAELLSETPLSKEQQKYVQVFRDAGENLLGIINDILDLSKVEAGQINLEHVDFDLADLFDRIGEIMGIRANNKGLELNCHIAPDVPVSLVGDPTRLRQVIVNLLGNAIKFTESGEIILGVRKSPEAVPGQETETVELVFTLKDTGIGIPPDKLDLVFERFTQADSSTTRKYGGTGLGLPITKRLAELMAGSIQVESEVGKGSVFTFTARFALQKEPRKEEEPSLADIVGCRALVIDDNATNRMIIREMLTGWGTHVTTAGSGWSGITALREAVASNNPYDFVILDYHMPIMDGFATATAIREDPALSPMVIIMLSSGYPKEDLAKARQVGIDQFLYKPVKRRDLREAISLSLGKVQPASPEAAQSAATETKPAAAPDQPGYQRPLRILLVEDNEDNRLLIWAYLKNTPHQVQMAENGAIAVDKFKTATYDIVLMDMQMPVMDGYTATREIRRWEQDQGRPSVPVIALTAHALKEDEQKSRDAGCDGHITKPIKKARLLEAMAHFTGSTPEKT